MASSGAWCNLRLNTLHKPVFLTRTSLVRKLEGKSEQSPFSRQRPQAVPSGNGAELGPAVAAALASCRCVSAASRTQRAKASRLRPVRAAGGSQVAADQLQEDRNFSKGGEEESELEAMKGELRDFESSRTQSSDIDGHEDGYDEGSGLAGCMDDSHAGDEELIDATGIERSGQVCVLGVPNAGKSSLVNALVGAKVSIVSPKPQTTRQKVLGLALVSPRPGVAPNTQVVFFDTAGIMQLGDKPPEVGGSYKRKSRKRLFAQTTLHKAMVRTAWKSTRDADALWWVLDSWKCYSYGDFLPECAMLDGVQIGPSVRDSWWTHPEMEEELAFMRRIRKINRPVNVVLNKVDLLREAGVDVEQFITAMREQLRQDLGELEDGVPMLQTLWPTSVLKEPESLIPLKIWLCENMPNRKALYPVEAVSDVPARVAASEITREKLFAVLRQEVPYATTVINAVWRETPDGTLALGQRIVVMTEGQERIVRGKLREITEEAEQEISKIINFGRPVQLHFQTMIEANWMENEEYYTDVQGLLQGSDSLRFPQ